MDIGNFHISEILVLAFLAAQVVTVGMICLYKESRNKSVGYRRRRR